MKLQTSLVLMCVLCTICHTAPWNLEDLDLENVMGEENGNDFEKNRRMVNGDSSRSNSEGLGSVFERRNLNAAIGAVMAAQNQQALNNLMAQLNQMMNQMTNSQKQRIRQQMNQMAANSAADQAKKISEIAKNFGFN